MNRNRKPAWLRLAMVAAGACCFADLSTTAAETPGDNASAAKAAAEHASATGNLLRNAGFESTASLTAAPCDKEPNSCAPWPFSSSVAHRRRVRAGGSKASSDNGVSLESEEVHSGSCAMRIAPPEGERVSLVWRRSAGPGRPGCAECVGPHGRRQGVVGIAACGRRGPQRPEPAHAAVAIAPAIGTARERRAVEPGHAERRCAGRGSRRRAAGRRAGSRRGRRSATGGRPRPHAIRRAPGRADQARVRGDARVAASLLDGGRRYAAKTAGAQRFRGRDRRRPGDLGRPLVATEKPEAGRIEERLAEGRGRGNDPAAAGPLETGRLRRGGGPCPRRQTVVGRVANGRSVDPDRRQRVGQHA